MKVVYPAEREHLAQLLQFMDLGEQLAHDCAKAQAELAPNNSMQTFLDSQARQEGRHALIFQWAIRWLTPRTTRPPLVSKHMSQYRQLLMVAIKEQNFAESLLAEQIILEGLGEAILGRLETGLANRKAPFGRLRRILLHQEEAHHAFGLRTLERMVAVDVVSLEQLKDMASVYFLAIAEDPRDYWNDFQQGLPVWLQHSSAQAATAPPIIKA